MPLARVRVRLGERLVEDRALVVQNLVRIGEGRGARVAFPGADIELAPLGRELLVQGRRLGRAQGVLVHVGNLEVWIENLGPVPGRRLPNVLRAPLRWLDPGFLLALALVLGFSQLWDAGLGRVLAPLLRERLHSSALRVHHALHEASPTSSTSTGGHE